MAMAQIKSCSIMLGQALQVAGVVPGLRPSQRPGRPPWTQRVVLNRPHPSPPSTQQRDLASNDA